MRWVGGIVTIGYEGGGRVKKWSKTGHVVDDRPLMCAQNRHVRARDASL